MRWLVRDIVNGHEREAVSTSSRIGRRRGTNASASCSRARVLACLRSVAVFARSERTLRAGGQDRQGHGHGSNEREQWEGTMRGIAAMRGNNGDRFSVQIRVKDRQ